MIKFNSLKFITAVVLSVSAVFFLSFASCDKEDDKDESGQSYSYVPVKVWDLTADAQFIVGFYPDDTSLSNMSGQNIYSEIIAQVKITLNQNGDGAGTMCYVGTNEPIKLENRYYAVLAFIDTDGDGYTDAGEYYSMKDFSVNGDSIQFDNPEFTANTF